MHNAVNIFITIPNLYDKFEETSKIKQVIFIPVSRTLTISKI